MIVPKILGVERSFCMSQRLRQVSMGTRTTEVISCIMLYRIVQDSSPILQIYIYIHSHRSVALCFPVMKQLVRDLEYQVSKVIFPGYTSRHRVTHPCDDLLPFMLFVRVHHGLASHPWSITPRGSSQIALVYCTIHTQHDVQSFVLTNISILS